jgi:hypothetical protein
MQKQTRQSIGKRLGTRAERRSSRRLSRPFRCFHLLVVAGTLVTFLRLAMWLKLSSLASESVATQDAIRSIWQWFLLMASLIGCAWFSWMFSAGFISLVGVLLGWLPTTGLRAYLFTGELPRIWPRKGDA